MNDGIRITIATTDDFTPSPRLRAALDELSRVASGSDDEVAGFDFGGLTVGATRLAPDSKQLFRDGCWGYSFDGRSQTCGWFKFGDSSCIGFYSG
ncbi:MAG: hypothetical protein R2713_17350 [Ilumatobacteraceae bacterium]|nr:hypothetical protein [Acidimicrobiales bacterium]MCB9393734.1 hypothetical protein [Acidimicrobiaceae bacterium]